MASKLLQWIKPKIKPTVVKDWKVTIKPGQMEYIGGRRFLVLEFDPAGPTYSLKLGVIKPPKDFIIVKTIINLSAKFTALVTANGVAFDGKDIYVLWESFLGPAIFITKIDFSGNILAFDAIETISISSWSGLAFDGKFLYSVRDDRAIIQFHVPGLDLVAVYRLNLGAINVFDLTVDLRNKRDFYLATKVFTTNIWHVYIRSRAQVPGVRSWAAGVSDVAGIAAFGKDLMVFVDL